MGFLQFQLLFARSFPAFWLGLGAVLVISAVSTTFSRVFSGFWESSPNLCVNSSFSYVVLPTLLLSSRDLTEWSLVYHNIKNTVIRNGNLYEPGPPAYTYVNLPLPCVHAGAFLRFMSIISYRILVAKRSDS